MSFFKFIVIISLFGDTMNKMSGKSYLLIGLILILVGIFNLIGNVKLFRSIADLTLLIMVLITIKDLFSLLVRKPKLDLKLFIRIFNVLISILALIFNEYSIAIVPIIFAIYTIGNAIVYFINFTIVKINKVKGGFRYFFCGIIYLIVGVIVLFRPIINLGFMLNIIGIYSILLGLSFITDYIQINHYYRFLKIRISLPSIIEAFIPLSVLQSINKEINTEENTKYEINKKNEKTDLEILIHVTENGFGRLGHMDICYKGEIISFGNYDVSSYKFHDLFGTGVVFTTKKKNQYIRFCIEDSKKTLFLFGLKLTSKEKEQIDKNILKLKEELKEWSVPAEIEKNKELYINKKKYMDYSNRIYRELKPKFYKFKKGKYKIFFVLGNNCVMLANRIIGKTLNKKFKFYGVLTPGTYYDFLEREFMKKNSIVVSKKIYSKSNLDNL